MTVDEMNNYVSLYIAERKSGKDKANALQTLQNKLSLSGVDRNAAMREICFYLKMHISTLKSISTPFSYSKLKQITIALIFVLLAKIVDNFTIQVVLHLPLILLSIMFFLEWLNTKRIVKIYEEILEDWT